MGGLAFLDPERRILRFAGARISLYWGDGRYVSMARADHCPLWGRGAGTYNDHIIPLGSDYP